MEEILYDIATIGANEIEVDIIGNPGSPGQIGLKKINLTIQAIKQVAGRIELPARRDKDDVAVSFLALSIGSKYQTICPVYQVFVKGTKEQVEEEMRRLGIQKNPYG